MKVGKDVGGHLASSEVFLTRVDDLEPWCNDSEMTSTVVQDVASVATAAGAAFVVLQLQLARRQLKDQFEQKFVERYNQIIANVPLPVILGEEDAGKGTELARAFYDYYDLCEEELYYRKSGRVSKATWRDWWYGFSLHFEHSAFHTAWQQLSAPSAPGQPDVANPLRQFTLLREAVGKYRDLHYDPHVSRFRQLVTKATGALGTRPTTS